jgi:hypothetical protein
MMNYGNGWTSIAVSGRTWIWTVTGTLLVVLLVVVITKLWKK